jgi:outer membrane receptor for ferrienterochelin and colicins
MKLILMFIALSVISLPAIAQQLTGRVFEIVENDTLPLAGVHVILLGEHDATLTDDDGRFLLSTNSKERQQIIVSHVSYEVDTIPVSESPMNIYLQSGRVLDEVVVTARSPDTYIADGPIRQEVITSGELEEAACCDLAGCFNRTASVERAVTDVLSDTKELRMLSISGVYTQILFDNIPWLTNGLNQSFAVSHVPGTMIDRIFVMKGLNSTLQGSEAISGQVNVIPKPAEEGQTTLFNAFANSFLESQYNLNYSAPMGEWSTVVIGHSTQRGQKVDGDGDSFLDLPNTTRYMAYNKWTHTNEEESTTSYIAAKIVDEERIGGQRGFNVAQDKGTMRSYGQVLDMTRVEAYGKMEHKVAEQQYIDVLSSFSTHRLNGVYGTTSYNGNQLTFYGDVRYESRPIEENVLTVGAGFRYLDLDEEIKLGPNPHAKNYDGSYSSQEQVAGIFIEDQQTFFDDDLSIIAGLRADNHKGSGTLLTPRVHVKYALSDFTTLRASAGTGNRTAHVFAENLSLLASSRNIMVDPDLEIEKASNFGLNLLHIYSMFDLSGTIGLDFYRTEFTNQIRPVYDENPTLIHFRNLDGRSYSNNFTGEISTEFSPQLDMKWAYTYSEVFEESNGVRKDLPFVPKHKVLATFSWSTREPDWRVDLTAEWFGEQNLPNTDAYPVEYRMASRSEAYTMLGFQITKTWQFFDFYAGVENVLDHRQDNPIIGADNPFGQYFEPTFIWGDVKGREAYAGFRWKIGLL